jgi:hypothetical protein
MRTVSVQVGQIIPSSFICPPIPATSHTRVVVCKAFDDMREKEIKIKLETGDIVSTHLTLDGPVNDISRVILTLADGRKFIGTGDDWFNALRQLRIQTDRLGIKLLVQASRPNCWPSGMSGQMSNGTKIYERDLAKPSSTWRVVNSFDEALETDIGSLKDQDEFNKKIWGTTN